MYTVHVSLSFLCVCVLSGSQKGFRTSGFRTRNRWAPGLRTKIIRIPEKLTKSSRLRYTFFALIQKQIRELENTAISSFIYFLPDIFHKYACVLYALWCDRNHMEKCKKKSIFSNTRAFCTYYGVISTTWRNARGYLQSIDHPFFYILK